MSLAASEVVLCAGAINSAALLLRSGIGPAEDLQALGIAPVADRPGVGRNYQNHSLLHFALTLKPQSRLAHGDRHYTITSLRFSSGLEGCPAGDLFLYFVGRVSGRAFGTAHGHDRGRALRAVLARFGDAALARSGCAAPWSRSAC